MTPKAVAASMTINAAYNPRPVALLAAAAALPHLLASGRADSPRVQSRRPRRLWGREDGFTMASPR
ncbi:hypothetical protein M1B72_18520 [Geomonas paludis]|uniref:Uncharacterized protein n=1 Tax=Geomonas paludis TaxID=2740185 RepID=A0ABY4LBQ8_9BACT|nr:hypothetical protein [Geomonas paludis]UPU35416.1 hypothetical protein M1B72_18520 [Geomonas paludis]